MKKMIFLIMMGFVFMALSLSLAEDIPMMLNYQGYVQYENGAQVNGNGYFKFAIVDPNGNTTYWSNDGTSTTGDEPDNAVIIPVTSGVFTIKLGNTDITNMSAALSTTVFDKQNIYVRVWFSDDDVTFQQMAPDTQILSAGFSYKAQSVVDNAVNSTIIQDGTITNADISNTASIDASKIDPNGLDADTLDGNDSSAFATASHTHADYAGIIHTHSGGEITSGTIPNEVLDSNLQDLADGSLSASKVEYGTYFIDSEGTDGEVWKSDGSGNGYWGTDNDSTLSESTVEGYIANDVSTNYIPRNNGTKLVTGTIYDDGTNVGIGMSNPSERLEVEGIVEANSFKGRTTNFSIEVPAGLKIVMEPIDNTSIFSELQVIKTDHSVFEVRESGSAWLLGSLTEGSDIQLKENISPIENALEKVSSIRGVYYNKKGEPSNKREVGVIAQELETVLPEAVSENTEGYKSVAYSRLTALLIEAVKELKTENKALKARISALEAKGQP